jgi:hypothetical protein
VKFQNLSIDLQLQLTVTRTVHKLYSNSPWELGREQRARVRGKREHVQLHDLGVAAGQDAVSDGEAGVGGDDAVIGPRGPATATQVPLLFSYKSNLAMASQRGIAGTSALDAAIALRERPSRRDEGWRPRSGRPPPRRGRRLPATPAPYTNPLLRILSVLEQIEGQRTQV